MSLAPKRIFWVDIARALGILAVVIGHSNFVLGSKYILPFFTPWQILIFPFLGGYLYKPAPSTRQLLLRKTQTLLLPYLVAGVLSYIAWLIISRFPPYNHFGWNHSLELINLITGKIIVSNGPLWFLPPYFLAAILMHFCYPYFRKLNRLGKCVLILALMLLYMILNPRNISLYFSYDYALLFFSFFLIGKETAPKESVIFRKKNAVIGLLLYVVITVFFRGWDIGHRISNVYILSLISSIIGVFLVAYTARLLSLSKGLFHSFAIIGKESMIILISHIPIMRFITLLLYSIGFLKRFSLIYNGTTFFFVVKNIAEIHLWTCIFLVLYTSLSLMSGILLATIGRRLLRDEKHSARKLPLHAFSVDHGRTNNASER